ncbi:MAG TPA: response regulator, partial [Planctomycetaceae bacterium]
ERAFDAGAWAFLAKPLQSRDLLDGLFDAVGEFVDRSAKNLLIVEPDGGRRSRILESVDAEDLQVFAAPDASSGLQILSDRPIDCVIVGPGASGFVDGLSDGGAAARPFSRLPVIVFDDGESRDGDGQWRRVSEICTVRRTHSTGRLLDLSAAFLHRDVSRLPDGKRQLISDLHQSDRILAGKRVLIVDDDMRNIFALSTVLEEHDMEVLSADNGRDAVKTLMNDPEVDIVLMDIMMPEMDGMQTMREIRKVARLKDLPIVAVTAKAMKGDREKCIEAGAWDYLSKPVDTEQLLAVLRAWLRRRDS